MRVKRQKRNRKIVRFYNACFGFREPFKILCDGTFIHHLLTNQINSDDGHALSKALGGPAKVFTTRCVIAELRSLGSSYSQSFQQAQNLITARCDHDKRINAAQCIEEVVGNDNSEHFFVATQDTYLRNKFQEVPGVPVVFSQNKSLTLDPPSASQRQLANKLEEQRLHATGWELKLSITADAPDTQESLEDQVVMKQPTSAIFKRNKAKGPNPLSCKKKRNPGNPSSASNQERKNDDNPSKKRNRKRKRSSKPGESDG